MSEVNCTLARVWDWLCKHIAHTPGIVRPEVGAVKGRDRERVEEDSMGLDRSGPVPYICLSLW